MTTKKKLNPAARKKELTGINLDPIQRRLKNLEIQMKGLSALLKFAFQIISDRIEIKQKRSKKK